MGGKSDFWRDAAWLASGTAGAQLIALVARPVFSRLYSPEDFAALNLFTLSAGFVAIAATWGYERLIQLPGRLSDSWRLVQAAALLGGLATLALTPLAFWQASRLAAWLACPPLEPWLPSLPLAGALFSLSVALAGWRQKRRQFRRSGQSEVAGQLANAGLGALGWALFAGPGGLILAFLGTYGGKIGWLIKSAGNCRGSLARVKAAARRYAALSRGLILSQTCLNVTTALPAFYVIRAYGAEELGQFALAWQIIIQPAALLGNAVGAAYYQRATEKWAAGAGFRDLWLQTARKLALLGAPVYGAAFVLSPRLFPLIFGPAWAEAGRYAAWLALSAFFTMVAGPLGRTCLIVEAAWYPPLWQAASLLSAALTAGAAWLNSWTMDGFVLALAIQQALLYLIDFEAGRRLAGRRPRSRRSR